MSRTTTRLNDGGLRRAAVMLAGLLIGLTIGLVPAPARAQVADEDEVETLRSLDDVVPAAELADPQAVVQRIFERTNQFRTEEDLNAVTRNELLSSAAQSLADFMAKTGKYGHTADGRRPSERAKRAGYEYCLVSENIAYQFRSGEVAAQEAADRFFTGWKESPGHRKNLLDSGALETGIAVAQSDETGYIFAVQMFGRAKSESVDFEITNQSSDDVAYEISGRSFSLPARATRTHQRCRPAEIVFAGEDQAAPDPRTFRAEDNDRFAVVASEGKLVVEKQ